MKPIIFSMTLILASAMAGEALAVCPASGQIMNISAKEAVPAVAAVKAVSAIEPVTEKYAVNFSGVDKKCSITVGDKTFLAKKGSGDEKKDADDEKNGADVTSYFLKNMPTGWRVTKNKSSTIFTSDKPDMNVPDLTYKTSSVEKNGCQEKLKITMQKTEGVSKVDAIKATKGIAAVAAVAADPKLTTLLAGNTVCVGSANNWQGQEFHKSGGDLIDWKQGTSSVVEPAAKVGSWNVSGADELSKVNYTYGGATYNDSVYDIGGGSYSFCDQNSNVTTALKIMPGQVACN
jgi:hypothetical protein